MNINNIWQQRFAEYMKETSRYLKYMFNDHLMIILFIALSASAVYYNQWLSQLSNDFPYHLIMGIVIGLFVAASPVRSFLKEPDLVFLLPIEHKMNTYFRNGFIFSLISQGFILFIVYIAFLPMYARFMEGTVLKLFVVFLIILILKAWNLFLVWGMYTTLNRKTRSVDYFFRITFNILLLVILFSGASFGILMFFVGIAIVWAFGIMVMTRDKSISWELLLEVENKQMNRFYRIANLFIDVPHLRNEVKPRRWLNWATANFPYFEKFRTS